MPENNATLKKKNQELREQVNALSEEIRKLKEHITEHSSSPDRSARSTEVALQFYSDADVSRELKRLSIWLAEISTRVDEIGKAIDSMCEYSYQYNAKCPSKWQADIQIWLTWKPEQIIRDIAKELLSYNGLSVLV